MMNELRVLGMSAEGERQLKAFLQVVEAGQKATSPRKQRQQEYRWQVVGKPCMGVGYAWYQEALRRGLLK
jgi:hypothetical protein